MHDSDNDESVLASPPISSSRRSSMSECPLEAPSPAGFRRSSVSSVASSACSSSSDADDGTMTLPPEGYFDSYDALEYHAQKHA
jgi:hypothetical protein